MDAVDCIGRVPFTLLADLRLARFGGLDAAELQMMRAQDLKQAQGVAKVKLSLETEEEPPTDGEWYVGEGSEALSFEPWPE